MVLVNRNGSKKEGMMKKILSIFLVFSLFIQQPAYSIAQASEPQKKGVIARAKATFSAMKEAMSRGNAMLKANSQCLLLGKGKDCTPEKRGMLVVIRDFTLGRFKKASNGIKVVIKANLGCFISILTVFGGMEVMGTVGGVEAAIRALATSKEKKAKFKEVWSRWSQRIEKGFFGAGLLPGKLREKWEEKQQLTSEQQGGLLMLPVACAGFIVLEIMAIIGISEAIFAMSPEGHRQRRLSREDEVRWEVGDPAMRDVFDTMQQRMQAFTSDTTAREVIEAFDTILKEKKDEWPDTYKAFLSKHGLTGPKYDDPEAKIKTFDQLGLIRLRNIRQGGQTLRGIWQPSQTLISLALLPELQLFPLGKYDEKRLKIINMLVKYRVVPLKEKHEQRLVKELRVAVDAKNKAKKLDSSASQALLDDIAEKAVRNYRRGY